jgi:hypothetical protein
MLLVTTSHSLLTIDPASGAMAPVHRGQGLYFGVATDGERLFVAARRRMVSSEVSPHDEDGRILVFDRALRLTEEIGAPFPLRDMHEILWHAGKLWITCSFDNMVAIFEPATGRWEVWHPLGPTPEAPYDVNHLNSLAVAGGELLIVAHNFGASELLRFDMASRRLLGRTPFGVQSHNIRRLGDGTLVTCSSGEGALIGDNGWRLAVGGFTRGLLLDGKERYVGISEIAERKDRDLTTGRIAVYDSAWRLLRTLELPGEGLVLDIQEAPA